MVNVDMNVTTDIDFQLCKLVKCQIFCKLSHPIVSQDLPESRLYVIYTYDGCVQCHQLPTQHWYTLDSSKQVVSGMPKSVVDEDGSMREEDVLVAVSLSNQIWRSSRPEVCIVF